MIEPYTEKQSTSVSNLLASISENRAHNNLYYIPFTSYKLYGSYSVSEDTKTISETDLSTS